MDWVVNSKQAQKPIFPFSACLAFSFASVCKRPACHSLLKRLQLGSHLPPADWTCPCHCQRDLPPLWVLSSPHLTRLPSGVALEVASAWPLRLPAPALPSLSQASAGFLFYLQGSSHSVLGVLSLCCASSLYAGASSEPTASPELPSGPLRVHGQPWPLFRAPQSPRPALSSLLGSSPGPAASVSPRDCLLDRVSSAFLKLNHHSPTQTHFS